MPTIVSPTQDKYVWLLPGEVIVNVGLLANYFLRHLGVTVKALAS